jgi:hypothetical protein
MKKTICVLSLNFVFVGFVSAQKAQPANKERKFIGQTFTRESSDPKGYTSEGGSVVAAEGVDFREPVKHLSSVFRKGNTRMVWLERVTETDAKGAKSWIVKDVLLVNAMSGSDQLVYPGGGECTLAKKYDPMLTVLVRYLPKKNQYQTLKAWRVNLETEKFDSIPIKGIVCEGFGT